MEFFKKLFGGAAPPDSGMYFYVQPNNCAEVVRVRLDTRNDISLMDDGTYYARKMIRANDWRCNQTVELEITFDSQKRNHSTEIRNGKLVTAADYEVWSASEKG